MESIIFLHLLLLLSSPLFVDLFSVTCKALGQSLHADSSALLQLKRGFTSNDELNSWRLGTDCCNWEGVTCDHESRRVIGLNLSNRSINGKIDPCLFNLTSLRALDFANNLFNQIPIPNSGWHRLANLSSLNLSNGGFVGKVPADISRLSKLTYLDLSGNSGLSLTIKPSFLQNMSGLRELYLSSINLSASLDEWCGALVNSTPIIEVLSMSGCSLFGGTNCSSLSKLPLLSVVNLGGNNLDSIILDSFVNFTSLVELRVSENGFKGFFPKQIFQQKTLKYLNISSNPMLSGSLPDFSKENNLEILVLSGTNFSGNLPDTISNLKFLTDLDLSNCQFFGRIPATMGNLSQLKLLDLSNNNKLQGLVPTSLFQIQGLVLLSLASNNFSGVVELKFIKNLKNLSYLDLSNSGVSLSPWDTDNGSFSSSFSNMSVLRLIGCNLTKFPAFIKHQRQLFTLDLSNNRIHGEIPSFLWSINEPNHSTFFIPSNISLYPNLTFFYLANNDLTGEIPPSICSLPQLQELDLSGNMLTGSIPSCLMEEEINLQILHLRRNQLSGAIPYRINPKCNLRLLNLRDNQLEGQLPKSLSNCQSLAIIDIGNNNLKDTFPYWLGNISSLRILVLRSNNFYGLVASPDENHETNYTFLMLHVFDIASNNFSGNFCSKFFNNFKSMMIKSADVKYDFPLNISAHFFDYDEPTIIKKGRLMILQKSACGIIRSMDVSNNYFEGEIPIVIGQLNSLQVLNMSQNYLTGKIPPQLGNLSQLESLDLSMNSLSGQIPQELASLYFLSDLNLSYNKLEGKIPFGGQFSTFPNTSFEGNEGLCCWFPYNKSAPKVNSTSTSPTNLGSTAPKNRSYMIVLGVLFGVGFGGCVAAIIVLDVMFCDRRNRRSLKPLHG